MEILAHSSSSAGIGVPIVILHGLGSSKRLSSKFLEPRLKENHIVISIDLPGHGESEPNKVTSAKRLIPETSKRIKKTLDHFGITSCILVGMSFGGSVALDFAARYSSYVRGLVLQGVPYKGEQFPRLYRAAFSLVHNLLKPFKKLSGVWWFIVSFPSVIRLKFGHLWGDATSRRSVNRMAKKDQKDIDRNFWEKCIHALFNYDGTDNIKRINCPVLLIDGKTSKFYPVASTFRIARILHNSGNRSVETALIPKAGHMLPAEKPDEFAGAIKKFIKKYFPRKTQ